MVFLFLFVATSFVHPPSLQKTHIIPFVESHYSASSDPKDRALCGLSMGSMTTNQMAMRYPDVFRYFGSFSGGMKDYEQLKDQFDADQLNQDVLFLTAGQIDMARNNTMGISNEDFIKMYDALGIHYDYKVYGGAHDWVFWRESFTVFARDYLWQLDEKKPEENKTTAQKNTSGKKVQTAPQTGVTAQGGLYGFTFAGAAGLAAAVWLVLKKRK